MKQSCVLRFFYICLMFLSVLVQNVLAQSSYDSQTLDEYLTSGRWRYGQDLTLYEGRSNPPGEFAQKSALEVFHETAECSPNEGFWSCNSAPGLKLFLNPPRLNDQDWTPAGFARAATYPYHTHASGIFIQSFGQEAIVSDRAGTQIAPSGIHLEPHGSHHGIRIDGSQNSGTNLRILTTKGATGMSVYGTDSGSSYCSYLGRDCSERARLLNLRNGTIEFEDTKVVQKISTNTNMNYGSSTQAVGIEAFSHWHTRGADEPPVHCVFHSNVTENSIVKVTPYKSPSKLKVAHTYVVRETWGAGNMPESCRQGQLIHTEANGVYGFRAPPQYIQNLGGFTVALLGPDSTPLYPGSWGPNDDELPWMLYEIFDAK